MGGDAWDWFFVIVTGLVALHGLTFRDAHEIVGRAVNRGGDDNGFVGV